MELSPIEKIALAKALSFASVNDVEILPHNTEENVDFNLHITGSVRRGDFPTPRRATNRALTVEAMVMLLLFSGVTRQYSPEKIIQMWGELGSLNKAAMKSRIEAMSQEERNTFDSILELFNSRIVDALPKIAAKGTVKTNLKLSKS